MTQYGFYFDSSRCTGCKTCELVCKDYHDLGPDILFRRIYDFEGGSNVVDVYMRYLRRKLDDPFEKKLIHTVRGSGYVIREEV